MAGNSKTRERSEATEVEALNEFAKVLAAVRKVLNTGELLSHVSLKNEPGTAKIK